MRNYSIEGYKKLIYTILIYTIFCPFSSIYPQNSEIWELPQKLCWSRELDNQIEFIIASDNAGYTSPKNLKVYIFSNSLIQSIDLTNQNILWEIKLGGILQDSPLIIKDDIFVFTSIDNSESDPRQTVALYSLNSETGFVNWRKEFSNFTKHFTDSQSRGFFVINESNDFSRIDLSSGEKLWSVKLSETIKNINVQNQIISATDSTNNQILISYDNGKILDKKIIPSTNKSLFEHYENGANQTILTDEIGNVESFNTQSKKPIWKRKLGGKATNVIFYEDMVVISSVDNFVYLFNSYNGKFLLKKRFDGRLSKDYSSIGEVFAFSSINSRDIVILNISQRKVINMISLSDAKPFSTHFTFAGKFLIVVAGSKIMAYSSKCTE